ncbi:hypothetical protein [Halorubrum sp. DTA98]|uniref:hypothetical protein n=1 Tax=Halorubrum sp. DTA98 TaxID=3402163 RepID=UPI003AB08815
MILPTDVGDSVDDLGRIWGSYLEDELDVNFSYTNNAGAGGLLANNSTWSADGDGSVIGVAVYNTLVPNGIARDAANYESNEFHHVKALYHRIRACQLSPETTHVEDHFDTDWDEFVANAPYTIGDSGVHHALTHHFIAEFADDLDHDDIQSVRFGSGSDVRAAVQRGDLDGYMGGFMSNLSPDRQEIYRTQWGVTDERYPSMMDMVQGYSDDSVTLGEIGYPQDALEQLVDVTIDAVGFMLPPDTPDEIVQRFDDAFNNIYEERSDEVFEDIQTRFGEDADLMYHEGSMEEITQFVEDKVNILNEYEDVLHEIFDE